ncbi:MAG: diaminopimelate epimerase [Bdellovibrionales bacterium]|nr:diaminopimelate epimerase [Bdellovibrionales bacterium]
MPSFRFYKYHGLGNDYIVLDPREWGMKTLPKAWIRKICDRHRGVGSDGILWGPFFEKGNPRLWIYNPDGSEAEKSGNGVRIFSRYLTEKGDVGKNFSLITTGGRVEVSRQESLETKKSGQYWFRVQMGQAQFSKKIWAKPEKLLGKQLKFHYLSIGNPHCVVFLGSADPLNAKFAHRYGPLIENHRLFPKRTNVQFVKILSRKKVQIEIWERGAEYTLASGSSSCAAVLAAKRQGWVDGSVEVTMPGGKLWIDVTDDFHATMLGPVEAACQGLVTAKLK